MVCAEPCRTADVPTATPRRESDWPAGSRRRRLLVGGAAMANDATRVTRDVDGRFVPHSIVREEAKNVADDLGLPC